MLSWQLVLRLMRSHEILVDDCGDGQPTRPQCSSRNCQAKKKKRQKTKDKKTKQSLESRITSEFTPHKTSYRNFSSHDNTKEEKKRNASESLGSPREKNALTPNAMPWRSKFHVINPNAIQNPQNDLHMWTTPQKSLLGVHPSQNNLSYHNFSAQDSRALHKFNDLPLRYSKCTKDVHNPWRQRPCPCSW